MKTFEELIRTAYVRVNASNKTRRASEKISEEDIAVLSTQRLQEKDRGKIIDGVISRLDTREEERVAFLLHPVKEAEEQSVPPALTVKVKKLAPSDDGKMILDVIVEFVRNAARVVETTGTMVNATLYGSPVPAVVYRDNQSPSVHAPVEISKNVFNYGVTVKIVKAKDDTIHLTVQLRSRWLKKLSSEERVNLMHEGREVSSLLTSHGMVEFNNIKMKDYHIVLLKKGESVCLARLSLKAL